MGDPNLIAAAALLLIAVTWLGYLYWRFYR